MLREGHLALFTRLRPAAAPPNTADSSIKDLIAAGRFGEARDLLHRATTSGATDLDAVRTLRRLAQCEREMAAYNTALAACRAGLELLDRLDRLEASDACRRERVRLLTAQGQTLIEAGRIDDAEEPLRRALDLSAPECEVEGALALRALGEVAHARASYAEAEDMYARAMTTLLHELPPIHRERGHVVNSWGLAALGLGRLAEAEERVRKGLELRTAMLPAGHPDIGESTHNLAAVLLRRGHLDEAEALERRALQIWEAALGNQHPRLAVALGNLGAIAQKRSRFAEAERFYRRTLEIRETALGPGHPRLIPAVNNLATIQRKLGHYAEAETLLRRSLALARAARGERHPDAARALNNLHSVLNAMGQAEQAEEYLRQAITIWEQTLGPESAELATSLTNLAAFQTARDETDAAEQTLLRVLQIKSKQLGENHPDLATPLNNLAILYAGDSRLDLAEQLFRRAQELRQSAGYGPSPETFANLAEIAHRQGRYAVECDYVHQAVAAIQNGVGTDAPAAALPLHRMYRSLGLALRELGDLERAMDELRRAVALGERASLEPAECARTLTDLGVTAVHAHEPHEAETAYRRGIELLDGAGNAVPARLAELLVLLGALLVMARRYAEAEPVLERAHPLAVEALGPEHDLVHAALILLGTAALAGGNVAAAERYFIGSFGQGDQGVTVNLPGASLALCGLRQLYRQTGRPLELMAVVENLIAVRMAQGTSDRDLARVLRELGDYYFAAGRYREAARLFARVQAVDDGHFQPAFRGSTALYLALCLARLDDDARAHEQFAVAVDTLRDNDPTGYALSLAIWVQFLATKDRLEDVAARLPELALCVEGTELGPETVGEVYQALGAGYAVQQRWIDAEGALRRSLAAWEGASVGAAAGLNAILVRHQLARVQAAQGRNVEGEAAFRDVIARFEAAGPTANRPLAVVMLDLAQLLEREGRNAEAAELRSRAGSLLQR